MFNNEWPVVEGNVFHYTASPPFPQVLAEAGLDKANSHLAAKQILKGRSAATGRHRKPTRYKP